MNTTESIREIERDTFKRAAAEAAVELVTQDMVVGLGSGSTAAFAIELLAQRHRRGYALSASQHQSARQHKRLLRVFRSRLSPNIGRSTLQSTARTRSSAAHLI
jgi:ribose 5-phosphate isomerase